MCATSLQITEHFNQAGEVDGVIKDIGQTKVDRLQVGQRKALRCRSDCTKEFDPENPCPVHALLHTKALIEKTLGLQPPMTIEESVYADYCKREDPPRGATVVACENNSFVLSDKYKPKHEAFMIVSMDEQKKGVRYRRGMELLVTGADGDTLEEVNPNSKGLWFEIEGKPYIVRTWANASEIAQRLRSLAIIAQRQARKAGSKLPFGNAFRVGDLKGILSTKSMRRSMATGHANGNVPMSMTMKEGGWAKVTTMLKYMDELDPFASSGINLTDVVVRGMKAVESTESRELMHLVDTLVERLHEREFEVRNSYG